MATTNPKTTPMMQQYLSIKENYRDSILLFRLGDFYEMFFDDAKTASRLLDLTLTSRNKNQEGAIPLCGIPYHAATGYINRLLAKGQRVAICEQTEDPAQAKGIVKREVVQVLSPGLVFNPDCLEASDANFLVSVSFSNNRWGLASADVSTGQFSVTEFEDQGLLLDEIDKLDPKEMLLDESFKEASWIKEISLRRKELRLNYLPGWHYDFDFSKDIIKRYYQLDLSGLHLSEHKLAALAVGVVLSYLDETKLLKSQLLARPRFYQNYDYLILNETTKRNLELTHTLIDQSRSHSLLGFMDQSLSPMGSRLLKEWLLRPLVHQNLIEQRHDAVEDLIKNRSELDALRNHLKEVADLERIQNRVLAAQAHARDVVGLKETLKKIPGLKESIAGLVSAEVKEAYHNLENLDDIVSQIDQTLIDEPPLALKDGGLIQKGFSEELDELRDIERNGKYTISSLEAKEREKTGISSLKIRYNRVFGYYIEVTHTHKDKVPPDYIRKQTLTNAERYITDELKQYEQKVLGASERIKELEYKIFIDLREALAGQSERIKKVAATLANLDALAALASLAMQHNFVRPQMIDEPVLKIVASRHPLVEAFNSTEAFVPNDVELNDDCRLMIITGPNMAGKSTVMRQVALTVLMAQMGSFVPAQSATIGIVDQIFTRIGASDHLHKGQSTFMVEMLETAQILAQATSKSLILLDEIGRGTSTFDGLSIAWAVCENIHDAIGARTLFATHYHELTDLASEKSEISNYHMAVTEYQGSVRFLRELKKGGTNRSYGVFVAGMAGLPDGVIKKAKKILSLLEKKDLQFQAETAAQPIQPTLFDSPPEPQALQDLRDCDLNSMTPLQALNFLSELKKSL